MHGAWATFITSKNLLLGIEDSSSKFDDNDAKKKNLKQYKISSNAIKKEDSKSKKSAIEISKEAREVDRIFNSIFSLSSLLNNLKNILSQYSLRFLARLEG